MNVWRSKVALLVRRELWEHKSLWLAPALVALVFPVLVVSVGSLHIGPGGNVQLAAPNIPDGWEQFFGQMLLLVLTGLIGVVTTIAIFVYLLDCLYAERKDRSILFWKSLPVSDTESVTAKLGVAMVLLPLLVLLLALLAFVLLLGLAQLRYEPLRAAISYQFVVGAVRLLPDLLITWVYCVLWYLPVVAYLLLASVLAKRAPLMYALMPPLLLVLLEWAVLDSTRVFQFLGERLAPSGTADWGGGVAFERGPLRGAPPPDLGSPDWGAVFSDPSLWLGVAVGVAMVYTVIRLRRYRDDT